MADWKLRFCPKCGGDVFMDTEEADWFAHCLQCGYTGDRKLASNSDLRMPDGRPWRKGRHAKKLKLAKVG